jgi:ribosomal protein L13E
MLIMMTEKLVKEKKTITRGEFVRRSGEIGDLEDRIRKRVEEILYELEGGGEAAEEEEAGTPPDPSKTLEGEESDQVRAVQNPDLFEAFNALWAAVRSLQIAEPDSALPPMRIALKALDRARLANRLYLRGIPPRVVVDIARVRMSGKDKGSASTRTPRTPQDSLRANLERRFSDAVELIPSKPQEAVRAFTLMQVEALTVSPQVASALGEAIDAFRKGRNATLPLLRARRALAGDPSGAAGLPAWSGGW